MSETTPDEGVIAVLIERLEQQRLPRLLALEEKANDGEPLDRFDLEYLENAIADARKVPPPCGKTFRVLVACIEGNWAL